MKTTHHIVYSTKGGCGKTAFSLLLAHCEHDFDNLLNTKYGQDKKDEFLVNNWSEPDKIKVSREKDKDKDKDKENIRTINCFIDFDLLSSSLTYYLKDAEINNDSIKREYITLQDIFEKNNQPNELKFMRCNSQGKNGLFIIPVDARQSKKEIFCVKRNNTPLLRYEEMTIFLEYIQKSIEVYLLSRGLDEKDELNFIYDLPLNSDGYTEAILDQIFKLNEKDGEKKENKRLYLVANCEPMMRCNLDWLVTFFSTYREKKCDVIIVCNDNLEYFKKIDPNLKNEEVSEESMKRSFSLLVDTLLKKIQCSEKLKNKLEYAVYIDKDEISMESFSQDEKVSEKIIKGIKIYGLQEKK